MKILNLPCNTANYKNADRTHVDYIVIHYTGNKGDTAANNAKYFASNRGLSASAHYFVDENEIWQSVENKDIAWHCGGKSYRHAQCRNANSIGVEICMWDKQGALRQGSIDRAALLVRDLMSLYGVSADRVLRHYDVTGKQCPAPMVDNPELWARFLDQLEVKAETVRYQRLTDIPVDYGLRATIKKLMNAGILNGDGSDPAGNHDIIDLSHDMVRLLVMNYQTGVYDDALKSCGLL